MYGASQSDVRCTNDEVRPTLREANSTTLNSITPPRGHHRVGKLMHHRQGQRELIKKPRGLRDQLPNIFRHDTCPLTSHSFSSKPHEILNERGAHRSSPGGGENKKT